MLVLDDSTESLSYNGRLYLITSVEHVRSAVGHRASSSLQITLIEIPKLSAQFCADTATIEWSVDTTILTYSEGWQIT